MIVKTYVQGTPEEVEARLLKALQEEGFGLLTRVPFHQVLAEKRGVTIPPYVRLGVCNPALAEEALARHPDAGVVLPCAVVVKAEGEGQVAVVYQDPAVALAGASERPDPELASRVRERLERAVGRLGVPA
jgi:uncharacterized protein (DUF302 family)